MDVFWIIMCVFIAALLCIEPIGYFLIRRTETIYVCDCYKIQYHSGDMVTRMYIVEDEDENVYLSEQEITNHCKVEIIYKGFNLPKLGLLRRIVKAKYIN